MATKVLRVLARGDAKVPDFGRMENSRTMAFIGRKYVEVSPGVFGSDPTHEVVELPNELPYNAEYIKALRDKELWAADAETALACGFYFDEKLQKSVPWVVFDPTYGGAVPAKEEPKKDDAAPPTDDESASDAPAKDAFAEALLAADEPAALMLPVRPDLESAATPTNHHDADEGADEPADSSAEKD